MTFGNSAFYLYLESVLGLILGYLFWIIVSISLGASVTGESSGAITLATIIATVSTLGIGIGIQRFLGRANSENSQEVFGAISKFAVTFTIISVLISSAAVLILSEQLAHVFKISQDMIMIIILSTISYALTVSLRAIIISESKTKILVMVLLASSVIRFATIIPIYFYNLAAEGIALCYVSFYMSSTILLIYFSRKHIFKKRKVVQLLYNKKEIITANISGWIPNVISIAGTHSGLLFVLGLGSATQAGVYFIAFSIFSAISALPMSLISMSYPVMSGMKEGRERLLWQATKMGLFSIIPIAIVFGLYPSSILSILGRDFLSGDVILLLFIISLVPIEINRAVSYLMYADGKYSHVIYLGSSSSLARIVFYVILVPYYGINGAGIAFLIGSLVGLLTAITALSRKRSHGFPTRDIVTIVCVPAALGILFYFIDVGAIIGSISIIVGSYGVLARLRIVRYNEVEAAINSIFMQPNKLSRQLLVIAKSIFT